MFSKLALSNVKKSIKDYTIYFLTLTFGICIFYAFNSIESQQAMMSLDASKREIIKSLALVIEYVSVFVSVILAFLIIFANKFLIKRRKKELGIYMILGMDKYKISKMLIMETLIIGVFSLVAGLLVGIFASQGLSIVTAKIFEADMTNFAFVFSKTAFIKSIIYFGIIYIVVMIFNTISVSKYKLITLLNASKQNEKLKVKKLWVSVVLFIISVISLSIAYYLIIKNGMFTIDRVFWSSIILGTIGTFLFFMSLSGFMLRVLKSNKKVYYKGLNMFVLRQINSKINTTFISMTVICLMLLITIGTISSGLGLNEVFTKNLKEITPYDVSLTQYCDSEKDYVNQSIVNIMEKDNVDLKKYAKDIAEVKHYNTKATFSQIITDKVEGVPLEVLESISDMPIPVVSISDYNNILKTQGVEEIKLNKNQYILTCNHQAAMKYLQEPLEQKTKINFDGNELTPYNDKLLEYSLLTSTTSTDTGTIVVDDELLKSYNPNYTVLNLNFIDKEKSDEFFDIYKSKYQHKSMENGSSIMDFTREEAYNQSIGIGAITTFLSLYIGIVFLITSVAVLALQQLSESADNVERYSLLRKLGAEEKLINKALFWQIFIYFMMPLALAIIHSVVGLYVAHKLILMFGNMNIAGNLITVATLFVVVYGGYFFATYLSSRSIIRARKN